MSRLSTLDEARLSQALALAEGAIALSEPNPRVGCVIGHEDGRVLASGSTQAPGQPHAEAQALRHAASAGVDVRGATAWVTLEPCAHHGRTPPCADALVNAGIARVVACGSDPFEQVNGAGFARLRAAGVEVVQASGRLAQEARELNIGFFSRVQRKRPWVRMKWATSLDGFSALVDGRSQWITGPAARSDGQAWRRRASAVLTGIGTVLADNPRLDVREHATPRQPLRIVLDSELRTPAQARLLEPPGRVLLLCSEGALTQARAQPLRDHGAEVQALPLNSEGRLDLVALPSLLAQRGINELHVEAGATLNGAFLVQGLVDELLCYVAPKLLGQGRTAATLSPPHELNAVPRWHPLESTLLEGDLRLRFRSTDAKAFAEELPQPHQG